METQHAQDQEQETQVPSEGPDSAAVSDQDGLSYAQDEVCDYIQAEEPGDGDQEPPAYGAFPAVVACVFGGEDVSEKQQDQQDRGRSAE